MLLNLINYNINKQINKKKKITESVLFEKNIEIKQNIVLLSYVLTTTVCTYVYTIVIHNVNYVCMH